ncbi:hypothetical protein [Micromonospora auratinigra]|uniref:Uncharacterized protein n=1 Tax=Micromonospora auratinigra TaxID=261654 RepID=A0A1A8Z594_9ACTN|nr:hypothetical protein [Micromonospora auratinigra]SBT39018.1 hypothetical protein GA0070611_0756 [Micromonospora auratinigra]
MGRYASVRGWLEIDFAQRSAAEQVIERSRDELYSGGWAFPPKPFNWTLYLFYGGDLRQSELPWLRDQVAQLAVLPPVDDDNDRPRGMFLVTLDDREPAVMWQVREGRLDEVPAAELSWFRA